MANRSRRPGSDADPAGRGSRGRGLVLTGILAAGFVLVGVAALGIGLQGAAEPTHDATARSSAGSTAPAPGSAGGDAFPIVVYRGAETLGAEELDFSELLGTGTPVVLKFWAGQCPTCRAEMPDFQAVYDEYRSQFLLVGVDIGPFIGLGSRQSAIDLLDELEITYPTAYALDARAVQDNQVLGMPTTIFYDGSGDVVARHTGLLTKQVLEERVRELIGAT